MESAKDGVILLFGNRENSGEHGRESGVLSGDLCGDLGVLKGDRDQDLDLERQHSASSSLSTESKLLLYPPLFRLYGGVISS